MSITTQTYLKQAKKHLSAQPLDAKNALIALNHALALDVQLAEAYCLRAIAHQAQNTFQAAMADLNRALELEPRSAEVFNQRGLLRVKQGDAVGGLADLDHAITLKPIAQLYLNRGVAYATLKQTDKALADFDTAIALNFHFGEAYQERGTLYQALGDFESAMLDYDQAIILLPQELLPQAYIGRCRAYVGLGNLLKAWEDLAEVIKLDPKYVPDWHEMGVIYPSYQS